MLKEVSWGLRGFQGVSEVLRVLQEISEGFEEIPGISEGFTGSPWCFRRSQWRLKEVQGGFRGVPAEMSQGLFRRFQGILGGFKGCQEASKEFQGIIGGFRSSQEPIMGGQEGFECPCKSHGRFRGLVFDFTNNLQLK